MVAVLNTGYEVPLQECIYCGSYHKTVCPMIKSIEYHKDGSIKKVEFKSAHDYSTFTAPYISPPITPNWYPNINPTTTWQTHTVGQNSVGNVIYGKGTNYSSEKVNWGCAT